MKIWSWEFFFARQSYLLDYSSDWNWGNNSLYPVAIGIPIFEHEDKLTSYLKEFQLEKLNKDKV